MELKWLEDFLCLASTHSFSKAAEERNTSQSTLSRRIQTLEDWLGVPLIDRSSHPVELSRAGEQFQKDAVDIVRTIYRARAATRARGLQKAAPLRFAAQYVIARYFLPPLLTRMETELDLGGYHLLTCNFAKGIEDMSAGQIDFLVCYYHPLLPEAIDRQRFPSLKIGEEISIPVCIPDGDGAPLYPLPGTQEAPLPYVTFSPDAPVGWLRQSHIMNQGMQAHLETRYESTMAEVNRELVLQGRGVAWLQKTVVEEDLRRGRLVEAGDEKWRQSNEIRVFRSLGPGRNMLEKAWDMLSEMAIP